MKIRQFVVGALQTNCYVLSDDKVGVIIDPADYIKGIEEYIEKEGLTIKYILLTHGHLDHVYKAKYFAERYSCKVLISEDDIELARSYTDGRESLMFGIDDYEQFDENFIKEDDIIEVGSLKIKVIEVPGHTRGGLAFLVDGYLFSGDSLFRTSIGRTDLPGGDFGTLTRSIQAKLFVLDKDTVVLPGHGPSTTIFDEMNLNPYFVWEY